FFIIQVIFLQDIEGSDNLYTEVSQHWDMQVTPGVPFFLRPNDSEQELRLLLGNHRMLSEQVRRSAATVHPPPATSLVAVVSPGPARRTAASPTTQNSIVAAPPGPSTFSYSRLPITNLPSGMSLHCGGYQ
ncbi:hypothetical protein FMUND_35, partial [Fusarium mundagurra]